MARNKNLPALRGARLLLVEDDVILLIDLETILREAGADIAASCRTVQDALAFLQTDNVTAAVLDVRLGGRTIAPVARELDRSDTPFVFYTGQLADDPALAEWPGTRAVAKPARAKAIITAVAEALHWRKPGRRARPRQK